MNHGEYSSVAECRRHWAGWELSEIRRGLCGWWLSILGLVKAPDPGEKHLSVKGYLPGKVLHHMADLLGSFFSWGLEKDSILIFHLWILKTIAGL